MRDAITDVPGIKVGHWTDRRAATGCTVVLAESGAVPGFHCAGGAPETIATDLLRPENTVPHIHAVLLTGGSAFGLAAATGVRNTLRDRGVGLKRGVVEKAIPPIPIVTGAVLFDLGIGRATAHPTELSGARAVARARSGDVAQGSLGAGTGCTVANALGDDGRLKSGIGTASARHESGLIVGAIAAVNAFGDVVDAKSGKLIAGPRGDRRGRMQRTSAVLKRRLLAEYLSDAEKLAGAIPPSSQMSTNTTLVVVATNASLDKAMATRLAIMANDGISHAVRPAHTPVDGDTVFVLATGDSDVDVAGTPGLLTMLGSMAADVVARAIVNGVQAAEPLAGVPSVGEWRRATCRRRR